MENKRTELVFEYDGREYRLAITADILKRAERGGFAIAKLDEKALTAPEELFYLAFNVYHRDVTRRRREEIYAALEDKDGLFDAINEMIAEAIAELRPKGNVSWRVER